MSTLRQLPPDICYLCLSRDRKIFRLSVKYSHIFGFLTNWYPQVGVRVCWECLATVERMHSFKAQAERAVWTLECVRNRTKRLPFRSLSKLDTAEIVVIDLLVYNNANSTITKTSSEDHASGQTEEKTAVLESKANIDQNSGTEVVYIDTADDITDLFKVEVDATFEDLENRDDSSKYIPTIISSDDDTRQADQCDVELEQASHDVAGPSTKPDIETSMENNLTKGMIDKQRGVEKTTEQYQQKKTVECDNCGVEQTSAPIYKIVQSKTKCDMCNFECSAAGILRYHKLTHMDPSHWPFECYKCHKRFIERKQLIIHESIHAEEFAFKCEECGLPFLTKVDEWIHYDKHRQAERQNGEQRYECDHCGKVFDERRKAMVHIKHHTKMIICEQCGYKCYNIHRLNKHMLAHLDPSHRPFECELCHKRFIDRYKLLLHTRSHTGERPFLCNTCGRDFISKEDLTAHMKKVHLPRNPGVSRVAQPRTKSFHINYFNRSGRTRTSKKDRQMIEGRFPCVICKIEFECPSTLKQHLNDSGHGKPYECNICGSKFVNKSRLQVHMTSHSDEKKFQCDECPATFKYQAGLWTHKLVHKGVTYQCNICKVKFSMKGNLVGHMRSHTNEKPYECVVCGKRFPWRRNLKNHLNTHRNV